jgi:hypothetical protein
MERPDQDVIALLAKTLEQSKRSSSVRLPIEFARDRRSEVPSPPLAQIMRRGGDLRLKVYLTIVMKATKAPHSTVVSSADLAAMLGLQDPQRAGSRRVSKAINDLAALGLLKREGKPGYIPQTTVLDPIGSGEAWDVNTLKSPYLTLPIELWRRGWLLALSGRAIALLIVLREVTAGRADNTGWTPGIRKRQYGFSDDTWTRALDELVACGLVDVSVKVERFNSEPRRRNIYKLYIDRIRDTDPGTWTVSQPAS